MTKEELRELAVWGMRRKLQEVEQQLAEWHREFPELFISESRPLLLRSETRADERNVFVAEPPRRLNGAATNARILAYLREHPMQFVKDIADALDLKVSVVSSQLHRLKKGHEVWQPENDFRWSVREERLRRAIAALPPAQVVKKGHGRKPGPAAPGTIAARVEAAFADGSQYSLTQLARELRAPQPAVRSAAERARRRGELVNDRGLWRRASAPRQATVAQPALPLDAQPAGPKGKRGSPRTKFWKERWYVHLQANGPEKIGDSAKALGAADSAQLITAAEAWLKAGILRRVEKGVYTVGPKKPAAGILAEAAKAYAEQHGNGAGA